MDDRWDFAFRWRRTEYPHRGPSALRCPAAGARSRPRPTRGAGHFTVEPRVCSTIMFDRVMKQSAATLPLVVAALALAAAALSLQVPAAATQAGDAVIGGRVEIGVPITTRRALAPYPARSVSPDSLA